MQIDDCDLSLLLDMLEQSRGIVAAVGNLSFAAFCVDDTIRYAVERRIEIIGEAAKGISDDVRDAHPDIPWRKIIAMRNILAHEYGEVEEEIVWRVSQSHIPELIARLEPIIAPLYQSD
ncbi:MAG TPA: DUF86 domain-containing protein [Candidatus Hydrogenedentes bacterium]|nr:DUF86 domain-containing protein [Candidatus Hydrogenedentota bacterium]